MNLKEKRLARGMTQEELARECGIKRTRIANYEVGHRNPKPAIAQKIAAVLGFSWTEFYEKGEPDANDRN